MDATKAQHLTFFGPDNTSSVALHVHGYIDGRASISAANWAPATVAGNVDWKVGHDDFSSKIVVDYEPLDVRSGQLTFELAFQ